MHTDRHSHAHRQTCTHAHRQPCTQTGMHTDRHARRRTDRHAHRQACTHKTSRPLASGSLPGGGWAERRGPVCRAVGLLLGHACVRDAPHPRRHERASTQTMRDFKFFVLKGTPRTRRLRQPHGARHRKAVDGTEGRWRSEDLRGSRLGLLTH